MKTTIKILLGMTLTVLCACSNDNDNFKPGANVPASCQEVHFDASNEAITMLDATSTQRTACYTLTRAKAEEQLTVPVTVRHAAEGLKMPETVEFADGELTTTFEVTAPADATEGMSFDFDVELQGDNVNPYHEDITRFSGIIAFPKVRVARMYFNNMSKELGYFRQNCYDIGGGRLCFPDFMHSGTDVWMLFDEKAEYTVDATITTTPSWIEDDTSYAGCKFVYCYDENLPEDDPNGGYTQFYPHGEGSVLTVTSLCFYYGDGWSGYNPLTGIGYFGVGEMNFNIRATTVYWSSIQFRFVDPETDDTDYSEPDFGIQPPIAADGTVLDMKAKLTYNDFGFGKFENIKATVGNKGTSLTFDDFMHSGISFTITHGIDNSFKLTSDYGQNEKGTWQFKDSDGKWIKMWPCGTSNETIGLGINLHSDFNQWNVADRKIVLELPAIYSYDYDYLMETKDRITLTW